MQHEQFFHERQEMYPNRSTETWNTPKNNPKQASAIPYSSVGKASIHSEYTGLNNTTQTDTLEWLKTWIQNSAKAWILLWYADHNLEGPPCRLPSLW